MKDVLIRQNSLYLPHMAKTLSLSFIPPSFFLHNLYNMKRGFNLKYYNNTKVFFFIGIDSKKPESFSLLTTLGHFVFFSFFFSNTIIKNKQFELHISWILTPFVIFLFFYILLLQSCIKCVMFLYNFFLIISRVSHTS